MTDSRPRTVPLLAVMCLGHVLLISAQVRTRGGETLVQSGAFAAFAEVQETTDSATGWFGRFWRRYVTAGQAVRENEALRRRLVELQGDNQILRARARRVELLEDTLSLKRTMLPPTLPANVIAGSPVGARDVTIDVGSSEGIERDMAVISVDGVVGRVVQVSNDASRVQLLISGNAAAHGLLAGTNSGGIVTGRDDGLLDLRYVSNQVPVSVGEEVLTSGQEGIYHQGLLIGWVETAEEGVDARRITVRPAVDFSRIDVVLVILPPSVASGGGAP